MRFGVLGTLHVRGADGADVRLGGPVRRQLLAALLCRVGQTVPAQSLIEDVWGELAPRSAAKTLQSHVFRLRDDLGRRGEPVLVTEPAGYRLAATDVDAVLFAQLIRDVPADPSQAIEQLTRALQLWRGEDAYLDFGEAAFAVGERLRLAELRSAAIDDCVDLRLRIGHAADLVADLETRVAAEPYRERGWEQLMLALYRSGRQADALGAFSRVRDLLAADLGVDPGPQLREMQELILRQDDALLAAPPPRLQVVGRPAYEGRCPYRGLAGYGEDDSILFVGRERLTAELAGRLAEERLVVVTGPSGSGKTSLLAAGLLPALRSGAIPGSASWRTASGVPASLADPDFAASADLIVIDQAEELFTVLTDAARARSADALVRRIEAGARVVISLRGDFFDRLATLGPLAALARSTVLVRPMRDDEIRRAILEPATRCGYVVDAPMVETALDEVSGRSGALPLLSTALVRAWQHRDGTTLTLAAYRAGGGMARALEAGAEEAWHALAEPDRPAARRLLVRLAAREGSDWVRRPLPVSDLGDGADTHALTELSAHRLVTVTGGRAELVHEALLTSWPRLREWLDERALSAELLEHLSTTARAWAVAGRPDADLYRGARLHTALDRSAEHPDDIAEPERAFLDVSAAAADRELVESRARAEREAAGRRRLRYAVVALTLVVGAALAAVVVAVRAQHSARNAEHRADAAALTADARRLAAESLSAPDLRTALLLAVAAYRLEPSADTRSALLSAVEKDGSARWRISTSQRVQWVGASADGSQVWISDNQDDVTRYDTATRRVLSHFPYSGRRMQAVSPDGRLLVASGPSVREEPGVPAGTVRILDARTGAVLRTLGVWTPDGPAAWHTAAFTGDGRRLVVIRAADKEGQQAAPAVAVYDVHHLDAPPRSFRVATSVTGLATGTATFAVTTDKGVIDIVDASSMRVEHEALRGDLAGKADPSRGGNLLALAPDASLLAAIGANPRVVVVPATNLSGSPLVLQAGNDEWQAIGFSPSGADLALGGGKGSVAVVSVATGQPVHDLAGDSGSVLGLAWAAGPSLFTGGLDSQVVSWDLSTGPRMLELSGPARPSGEYGVVGPRLVGFYPVQPGDGGSGPVSAERLLVTDLASGTTRSWPLGLHGDDYIANDSRDALARWALLTITDSDSHARCELHDLATGAVAHTFDLPHPSTAAGVCVLSRDGRTAIVATGQQQLTTYRMPTFSRLGTVHVTPRGATANRVLDIPLGYTPDGHLVVWCADPGSHSASAPPTDQLLDVVDAHAGAVVGQAGLGPDGAPQTVNYSPDGKRLLVGTNAGTISLYALPDLRPIATGVSAADGFVFAATFSPDGSTVVTTGTDATMRFFDAASLQPIGAPITMPGADWTFAGFDGNGGQVAGMAPIGSGALERYFTFPGDARRWAQVACDIAGSELDAAEWARYVGDRPYSKVCSGG